jgi:hypothetical protein
MSFSRVLPPVAALTGPPAVCVGQGASFTGSGFDQDSEGSPGGLLRYDWSFGDGTQELDGGPTPPAHVYTAAGSYLVSLTVTDDDGPNAQLANASTTILVRSDVVGYGIGSAGCSHPLPLLTSTECVLAGQHMTIEVDDAESAALGALVLSNMEGRIDIH